MATERIAKPLKRNVIALMLGVLVRPKATFGYLKDNGKRAWWLPAILILLLIVAPSIITLRQTPAEMLPASESAMPPSAKIVIEAAPENTVMPPRTPVSPLSTILKLGGSVLSTLLAWLIWGAALYLASVFLGRSSSFGQMLRLTVWAWLPYGVRGLVQAVYMLLTGESIVNQGLSGFVIDKSTSSLIPPGPGQLALASILGRVDIYMLWFFD